MDKTIKTPNIFLAVEERVTGAHGCETKTAWIQVRSAYGVSRSDDFALDSNLADIPDSLVKGDSQDVRLKRAAHRDVRSRWFD